MYIIRFYLHQYPCTGSDDDMIFFDTPRKTFINVKLLVPFHCRKNTKENTVDSRYLEFDGTMEKIRVNRSSTQEELRRYRKRGLFNNERETTGAKF